jgi:HK97 family phage major capsid protein
VSERGARPETTTPQIGQWRIQAHELYAEPRATQKLLDDAQVDPEQWLAGKVSSKFSRDEATAFVTGDGNGKPRGFLTYADGVPTKALWKVIERTKTGVNGAFAATNKADIFIDVMGKMKDAYFNGSVVWAMNRTVRSEVRKLKNAVDGTYLLAMDISQGLKQTVFGIPVASFEDMPAIATGSLSIALANFAEAYQIVDRIGIRVLRDPFTSKPYVKFYTTKRVGGDVINHEAIKLIEFSA